jgi:acetyl esterase
VVLGISAGSNLAAVVCQKAKLEGLAHRIKLQVLNCQSTENPGNFAQHPSHQRYASGYFQTKAFSQYSIRAYAPHVSLDNPEVAPLHRKNVLGLPPAVIITAESDPLRYEGYAYAERLRKAGVAVRYECFGRQIHCLLGLPRG